MAIHTQHLARTLQTSEASFVALKQAIPNTIDFEIYRNAVIKGFELTLEVSGIWQLNQAFNRDDL